MAEVGGGEAGAAEVAGAGIGGVAGKGVDGLLAWRSRSKVCTIQKRTNMPATEISTQNREITLVSHNGTKTATTSAIKMAIHV